MKGLFLALCFATVSMFAVNHADAAISNYGNRPQTKSLLAISASKKIPVIHAHKKMKILSAKLITTGAIAASGANYFALKLQKSAASGGVPADVALITAVDTQAGVAAYGHLNLDTVPEIVLNAGETLYVDAALTGTLTIDASLSVDYEVVGR